MTLNEVSNLKWDVRRSLNHRHQTNVWNENRDQFQTIQITDGKKNVVELDLEPFPNCLSYKKFAAA